VNKSYTFTTPGVYLVSLTVTDPKCGTATANTVGGLTAMVIAYDPNAGFVTGGGWINSPAGAYPAVPALTGAANFGFESKYKKGMTVPTGETEFQFKVGNLNFHSSSYQWLVVSGPMAQYKGTGTISNAGSYSFLLSCVDGQISGGGGTDKFRMKITDGSTVVYDNQLGALDDAAATTVIAGGSIVVHSTSGGAVTAGAGTASAGQAATEASSSATLPLEYALSQNAPNPFGRSTLIRFALPEKSRVSLAIYDISGRQMAVLADGEWEAGSHQVSWSRATSRGGIADAGVYFVRMRANAVASGRQFSSLRKMILVK